jgi:hypothetical protein
MRRKTAENTAAFSDLRTGPSVGCSQTRRIKAPGSPTQSLCVFVPEILKRVFSNEDSESLSSLWRSIDRLRDCAGHSVHDPIPPLPELRPDIEKRFGESGFV